MPAITADFQERRRVVFSARGRSFLNVRESLDDGPIGFTSIELLLSALGNCSLGTLLNHPLLKDETVYSARASIEAEMEANPDRVTAVTWDIRLVVANPALIVHTADFERIAIDCPTCNSISGERLARVTVLVGAENGLDSLPDAVSDAACVVDVRA